MAKNSSRPTRVPVSGARNILTVSGKDPNYAYRFVNDIDHGMRVQMFKDGGWEIVDRNTDIKVGDKVVDQGSVVGSTVTRYVGHGVTAVLMRIPLEWYEEDQAAKAAKVDEVEATMQDEQPAGNYGSIKIGKRV